VVSVECCVVCLSSLEHSRCSLTAVSSRYVIRVQLGYLIENVRLGGVQLKIPVDELI